MAFGPCSRGAARTCPPPPRPRRRRRCAPAVREVRRGLAQGPPQSRAVASWTWSIRRETASGSVSGQMPWPRLKMCPGRAGIFKDRIHLRRKSAGSSKKRSGIEIALYGLAGPRSRRVAPSGLPNPLRRHPRRARRRPASVPLPACVVDQRHSQSSSAATVRSHRRQREAAEFLGRQQPRPGFKQHERLCAGRGLRAQDTLPWHQRGA